MPLLIRERLFTLLTKTLLRLYMSVEREQEFRGLRLLVPAGCFPPLRTVSTELVAGVLGKLAPAGRALDIGCGPGSLALLLARAGAYVVGVDVSLECLRAAKLNALLNNLYHAVDFVACDAGSCIRGGSVDLCVTNPPFLAYPIGDDRDLPLAGGMGLEVALAMVRGCLSATREGGLAVYTLSDLASGRRPRAPGLLAAEGRGLGDRVFVFVVRLWASRSARSSPAPA